MPINLSSIAGAGWQFLDNNGIILSGGKLYIYFAGTTTPATTYTSSAGTNSNPHPIILDSSGRVAEEIWTTSGNSYKFVLKDSNDNLIWTKDDIQGINDLSSLTNYVLVTDLANTTDVTKGDNLVGFKQSNLTGVLANASSRTVHQKFQEIVNVNDFGAVGDGVTNDTKAIQDAVDYAATINGVVTFPSTGTFTFAQIIVPSNITIQGFGAKLQAPSGYNSTSSYNAVFEAVSVTNVNFFNLNFGMVNLTDKVVFIKIDSCSNITVNNCDFIGNKFSCVGVKSGNNINITNNRMRIGASGIDYGIGIRVLDTCTNFNISGNTITGYKVTKFPTGAGIQPSGDSWGSVGINLEISNTFTQQSVGFSSFSGTYVIPTNAGPTSVTIPNSLVTEPDNWYGAAVIDVDSNGMPQLQSSWVSASFTNGNIVLSNIPGGAIGKTITYQAFYYGRSPRYGVINNNYISGMIFAGISIITGRDISADNNYIERIGDLGWDPEGAQNVYISNSTFAHCATAGAIYSGLNSSITSCNFIDCDVGISMSGTYGYQGFVGTMIYGIQGNNVISGCNFYNESNGDIIISVPTAKLTIENCSASTSSLRSFEITNASYLNLIGNVAGGRIGVISSNYVDISSCVIFRPRQFAFILTSVNKFRITESTVKFTSTSNGGGNGLTYTNCNTGYIQNNWFMNIVGTSVVDGGGNTSVTAASNTTM